MIKPLSIASLALAAVLSSNIAQAESQELNQLKNYIDAKEYQKAFELSEQLTYEFGGESQFDLLAGIAAFASGNYQEAVFAFERVVLVNPKLFEGRYYLALCYRKLNNIDAAIVELEKLSSIALTQDQRYKVDTQLRRSRDDLLDIKRTWSQTVSLSLGTDRNINGGTSLDEVELPDGTVVPLLDSSKVIRDTSYAARYQAKYQHPINQYQIVEFDLGLQHLTYNHHDEYKRETYRVGATYRHKFLNDSELRVRVSTAPLFFANDKYRTQDALSLGWQQSYDRQHDYGINASVADIDYAEFSNLDLTRYQTSAFYRYQSQLQHMFLLNSYVDENKQGLAHNDRYVIGGSYTLSYPIMNNLSGSTMVSYEEQRYRRKNPFFNDFNHSSSFLTTMQFIYEGFKKQLIFLQLSYQEKDIESDNVGLKIYEYNRFESSVTWQYKF